MMPTKKRRERQKATLAAELAFAAIELPEHLKQVSVKDAAEFNRDLSGHTVLALKLDGQNLAADGKPSRERRVDEAKAKLALFKARYATELSSEKSAREIARKILRELRNKKFDTSQTEGGLTRYIQRARRQQ